MDDRDERGTDVLADAHEQEGEPAGGELGGGLGNTDSGGANDG